MVINHGLLICSFFFRKKYSRTDDEILMLNQEYEYDGHRYGNVFSLFEGFFNNYKELEDDEKLMKMFSVEQSSVKCIKRQGYTIVKGSIFSGSYGTESQITNKMTKKVVYRRGKEDADIKQFDFLIYVPEDYENNKVVKGIILFETIGAYGVKTITTNYMKRFFSEKYGLMMETRSISVRIFVEKLLKDNTLNRVTLVKNRISNDPADNMFINTGREEKTYIKPKLKQSWIDLLLEHLDGTNDDDIFEINDEIYEDIKLSFSHEGRIKTVRLKDIDRFSIVEDIPSSVYDLSTINRERLGQYMEESANAYASRMVFVRG